MGISNRVQNYKINWLFVVVNEMSSLSKEKECMRCDGFDDIGRKTYLCVFVYFL